MNNQQDSPELSKIEFIQPTKIKIDYSSVHYRGIFATQDIETDELIERCPMVPMSFRSKYQHDPRIWEYLYTQPPCPCNECTNHGFLFHMVLGYGMIYNHQDTPNARWKFDYTNLVADVIAQRRILAKEEIFVSYGERYFQNREKVSQDYAKNT